MANITEIKIANKARRLARSIEGQTTEMLENIIKCAKDDDTHWIDCDYHKLWMQGSTYPQIIRGLKAHGSMVFLLSDVKLELDKRKDNLPLNSAKIPVSVVLTRFINMQ